MIENHNIDDACIVKFLILGQVETVTWAHNPEFCGSNNKMSYVIERYLTKPSEFLGRSHIGLKFELLRGRNVEFLFITTKIAS